MVPIESMLAPSRRGLVVLSGQEPEGNVIWLQGEHDLSTVETLSETLARVMELDEADVVLDLHAVRFMGAATVGVILRACELLRPVERSLVLRSPSVPARRILVLCGLGGLISQPAEHESEGALGSWVEVPSAPARDCQEVLPAGEGR